jgi:pilus assembly protein Flp/PilA
MRTSFARFVKDESGATAIEYGLIAAGIAKGLDDVVSFDGDRREECGRHLDG